MWDEEEGKLFQKHEGTDLLLLFSNPTAIVGLVAFGGGKIAKYVCHFPGYAQVVSQTWIERDQGAAQARSEERTVGRNIFAEF